MAPTTEVPVAEGTVLWEPSPERIERARITRYLRWLAERKGLDFADYADLGAWSVTRVEDFWPSIWEYCDVPASTAAERVLVRGRGAEGATWFEGATLNYVDLVVRQAPDAVALVACDEEDRVAQWTYGELCRRAGAAAAALRQLG